MQCEAREERTPDKDGDDCKAWRVAPNDFAKLDVFAFSCPVHRMSGFLRMGERVQADRLERFVSELWLEERWTASCCSYWLRSKLINTTRVISSRKRVLYKLLLAVVYAEPTAKAELMQRSCVRHVFHR